MRPILLPLVLLTAPFALRNHIDIPLTCSLCDNKLTEIVVHLRGDNVGVPAYVATMEETESDATFALAEGDAFEVTDQDGAAETVTFHAAQFADIANATTGEVIAAINAQLTLAQAFHQNDHLFLRGKKGGSAGTLTPQDVSGTPLSALMINAGERMMGADEIGLALSIPAADGAYPHHPYVVLVSATPGSTVLASGVTIPLQADGWTRKFLRAVPSLSGQLDAGCDAAASIPLAELKSILGDSIPDALYFAFVVRSTDGSQILYASNRFTASIAH